MNTNSENSKTASQASAKTKKNDSPACTSDQPSGDRNSNPKRQPRMRVMPELRPFLSMLPEIGNLDGSEQERLFRVLYSAGIAASASLHKWLTISAARQLPNLYNPVDLKIFSADTKGLCADRGLFSKCSEFLADIQCKSLPQRERRLAFSTEDVEALKNLSRSGLLDEAVESLRQYSAIEEELISLKEELSATSLITPEIAAAALSAFAAATLRRPPTRTVESLMASSQDPLTANGAIETPDDESMDLNLSDEENGEDSGDMLLNLAVSAGYLELTRRLVELRGSPNYRSRNYDRTPLMEACCAGHVEIASFLLERGADVNAESATHNTPLIYASAAGHLECVELLVKFGCDMTVRNDNGHCALMEAASSGSIDVILFLIENGAVMPAFKSNDLKESPLTLAAYKGHYKVVKYFLELGGHSNKEELHTALMEASMDGHIEVAHLLLANGAPVNLESDSFESPLTLAACGGHTELVKLLLERGAIVEEVNDEGYTPLMEASREGHLDVAKLLLKFGANVDSQTEETGETALTLAACGGFKKVVELLVDNGARLDLGSNTPLMEAAQEGHVETMKYILEEIMRINKLAVDATTATGDTALTYAAENGHLDICSALIESGAYIDHEAENGRTALMKAAKNGNYSIVQFLIMKGAEVNKTTAFNDASALLLACANGHWEIVRLLLDHGADASCIFKDGVSCFIEAARNGHTRVAETLLNWHDVPIVERSQFSCKPPPGLPCSRHKKISHGTTAKAATNAQPKVECAEKSVNSAAMTTSKMPETSAETALHPLCTHHSKTLANHNVSTIANIPAHILKHCYQQNSAINSHDIRGMIAGMAAMAAQSNALPNEHLLAQIAEKALRGTLANSQQFSELLKQQFNILAGRQKDALAGFANTETSPSPENGGNASARASVTSSPSPPMVACCETTAARAGITQPSLNTVQKGGASHEKARSVGLSKAAQQRRIKNIPLPEGKEPGDGLPSLIKFPAPPPPVVNAGTATVDTAVPSPFLPPSPTTQQAIINTGTAVAIGSNPTSESSDDKASRTRNKRRNRRTVSESAVNDGECQETQVDSSAGQKLAEELANQFNINMQTESNHDTALTFAANGGHDSLVELLISRGADIEHRDKKGFTPLILAATGGHVNVVELLLNAGANIEAQSERTKDTALSLACSGGRSEVVELLLKRNANKEHRNVSDYTPLSLAASGGYVGIVNMLLSAGAEINSRTGSKLGISPLMLAAMNGHAAATKVLLERGSDINSHIETNRNTALTLACFQGRTEVVQLLLEYNANVEHRAKTGLTPLMEAANGGYVDVGELLLAAGADPNAAPVPTSRDTALTIAADKGHHKFVEMLIHSRAQIDAKNKKGCTALWLACHGGHLETVQTLVKHQADVDAQDNRRVSPIIIAFRRGHLKVVKYMVRHVQQFPSDQECHRYLASIIDKEMQDLHSRCNQCMAVIVQAKEKQAEEANRVAESLLRTLAEEEELAKSKKLSKQRQNEKKKAKRRAKKNVTDGEKKETEFKETDSKEPSATNEDESGEEDTAEKKSDSSEINVNLNLETQNIMPEEVDPPRVPVLPPDENSSADEARSPIKASSSKAVFSSSPSKARQRIRKESSKAVGPSKVSPSHKIGNPPDSEWMKAKPRRSQINKYPANTRSSIHSKSKDDNSTPWRHSDVKGQTSVTLTVSSSAIARVIGRGGVNINAIREATGAFIDVEKQDDTKEQLGREITVKGTEESVKHAVEMIYKLIDDGEFNMNDIIRSASSVDSSHSYSVQSDDNLSTYKSTSGFLSTASQKKVNPTMPSATVQTSSEMGYGTVRKTNIGSAITNVWAQRAAERQKVVSAIGSEKKQKIAASLEQHVAASAHGNFDNLNPSSDVQPGLSFVGVYENAPSLDEGKKDFSRAPGHARPSSASASSASASPLGFTSPLRVPANSEPVSAHVGSSNKMVQFPESSGKSGQEKGIGFRMTDLQIGDLTRLSHSMDNAYQGTQSNSLLGDNLFRSAMEPSCSVLESSIAKIWENSSFDEKPWNSAVGQTTLPSILSSRFPSTISSDYRQQPLHSSVPSSLRSPGGTSSTYSSVNTDHLSDHAYNIESLRLNDDRAAIRERSGLRHLLGDASSYSCSSYSQPNPVDWVNPALPSNAFSQWRGGDTDLGISKSSSNLESDSSLWMDNMMNRFATQTDYPFYQNAQAYNPAPSARNSQFACDIRAHGQQSVHPQQTWNQNNFRQATQAVSSEFDSLTNLLNSFQSTPSQHYASSSADYGAANANVSNYLLPGQTRSQMTTNTSVPPPPFFNSHVPPPSTTNNQQHAASPNFGNTSAGWPSTINYGQSPQQASNTSENPQFPQQANRNSWNFNW